MVSPLDVLFVGVVSFLLVHELDAVKQQEWRFFVQPVEVSDETASRLFVAVHLPLFVLVLLFMGSSTFQLGIDAFAVFHGLLHLGLRNHPLVNFESWSSRFWIYGGSVIGILHFALVL